MAKIESRYADVRLTLDTPSSVNPDEGPVNHRHHRLPHAKLNAGERTLWVAASVGSQPKGPKLGATIRTPDTPDDSVSFVEKLPAGHNLERERHGEWEYLAVPRECFAKAGRYRIDVDGYMPCLDFLTA